MGLEPHAATTDPDGEEWFACSALPSKVSNSVSAHGGVCVGWRSEMKNGRRIYVVRVKRGTQVTEETYAEDGTLISAGGTPPTTGPHPVPPSPTGPAD